jgi:type IV pilus assembly protein PilM
VGKQVVGLKIGASSLAAACVEMNGEASLVQIARAPMARGIVAEGEVRDVPALVEALKAFFKEHKLPRRNVRVGIATNRVGVRTIELSGIADRQQLANAVRFRAQEVLPIPVEEAVLDFHVLDERIDEEGIARTRVVVVVAYRDLVEAFAAACRQAGLRLLGVDLEAFALVRALAQPPEPTASAQPSERSALVAVGIGAERSILAVSDGSTCEFTRVLPWGGTSLTVGLAGALGIDAEDAELLKRRVSLDVEELPEGLSPEEAGRARDALRTGLQGFARELVSSLQFYQGQPDSLGIREIVIAGGAAQLKGLAPTLQQLVGVAVRIGDPLVGVSVGKKLKGGVPDASLAVPIGLGIASS